MLLYNYSPSDLHTSYYVRVHDGQGLGSMFARLFSKIAVKTAAKTALNVAKVAAKKAAKVAARQTLRVGKKALKVAAREGQTLVKRAGKEAIKEAKRMGTDAALQGIDFIQQKATNKVGHPELIHSVANFARGKTHAGANKLSKVATHQLDTTIDKLVARHLPTPQPANTKKNQRKRKAGKQQQHKQSKKRKTTNRQKTLSELIEQV